MATVEDLIRFSSTLKELYKRIELLNFKFPIEFETLIIEYFKPLKVYNILVEGIFPIIERVTVNKRVVRKNIRIHNTSKLKYPPSKCINNYGRANLKQQSVFYATFNFMTAIKEIKPEKGDFITVSQWVLINENESLVICPMFLKQPNNGSFNSTNLEIHNMYMRELKELPPQVSELYFNLHKFYSDCFAREIEFNQGYIFTALLADKILNQYKNGQVDAILYPSTKEDLVSQNIVIKKDSFDKKYKLFQTIEKRLINTSENGDEYVFEKTGKSFHIDDEKIIWK